ncbi:hypothetical protein Tco_1419419 [Tanacetum coccineum]
MVAYLERTEGNVDFHQIVDFLNASTIRVERAAITAASLDAEQDSGNILKTQSTGNTKIGTSKRKSLDEEYVSKQGRKSDKTKPMFDDSDFAELDVDNAMKNVEGDAKTQGRNTIEQTTDVGDTVNTASINVSTAGLQMEKAVEQEAKDAALIEQIEDIQARMDADELLAEIHQQEEREKFTIEEKSRMLVEMIAERKRFFATQRTEQFRNKPPTRA